MNNQTVRQYEIIRKMPRAMSCQIVNMEHHHLPLVHADVQDIKVNVGAVAGAVEPVLAQPHTDLRGAEPAEGRECWVPPVARGGGKGTTRFQIRANGV